MQGHLRSCFLFEKIDKKCIDTSIPRDMMYIVKGSIVWMLN